MDYRRAKEQRRWEYYRSTFRWCELKMACIALQSVAHCNSLLSSQKSARSSGRSTGKVAPESLNPGLNPGGDKNPGQVMQLCTEIQHIKGAMFNEEKIKPAEQRVKQRAIKMLWHFTAWLHLSNKSLIYLKVLCVYNVLICFISSKLYWAVLLCAMKPK